MPDFIFFGLAGASAVNIALVLSFLWIAVVRETYDYRCRACLAKWRKKHGVVVRNEYRLMEYEGSFREDI